MAKLFISINEETMLMYMQYINSLVSTTCWEVLSTEDNDAYTYSNDDATQMH